MCTPRGMGRPASVLCPHVLDGVMPACRAAMGPGGSAKNRGSSSARARARFERNTPAIAHHPELGPSRRDNVEACDVSSPPCVNPGSIEVQGEQSPATGLRQVGTSQAASFFACFSPLSQASITPHSATCCCFTAPLVLSSAQHSPPCTQQRGARSQRETQRRGAKARARSRVTPALEDARRSLALVRGLIGDLTSTYGWKRAAGGAPRGTLGGGRLIPPFCVQQHQCSTTALPSAL